MSFATKVKLKFFIRVLGVSGSMLVSKTKGNCSSRLESAKLFIDIIKVFYIGVYISWLDSEPDKFEVVGSSPTTPTK